MTIPSSFTAKSRKSAKGELHFLCVTSFTAHLLTRCASLSFTSNSASGHVYVAKVLSNGKKVAIKEMDLSHQPRKELIVNEILVMKESQHPNIVNYLESYLVKNNELWVVMEYMEGGALTDIIENNTLEEDQISSICLEVRRLFPSYRAARCADRTL